MSIKVLGCILISSIPLLSHADIYQCKEQNGTTSFQSKPCGKQQVLEKEIEKTPKGIAAEQKLTAIVAQAQPEFSKSKDEPPFYLRWFNKIKALLGLDL